MSFATADERYFVELVNATRRDLGLTPLTIATQLNDSADAHTQWMLDTGSFTHAGIGGSKSSQRMREAGFPMDNESWGTRENLALVSISGSGDLRDEIRDMHRNLLDSPSHYAAMTDPALEYVGIGLEVGTYQGHRVLMGTQNFGRTTGQPDLDTGMFPSIRVPRTENEAEGRDHWLDDVFDGMTKGPAAGAGMVNGTARSDDVSLGGGADRARGHAGDDWINGRAGNDTLEGGAGSDRLLGGAGNDRLGGGLGDDVLEGQGGDDRLNDLVGNDLMRGGAGNDVMFAGAGNDTLFGGSQHDQMTGGAGDDHLLGGLGHDTLHGSAGTDLIDGGFGNDILSGGIGADGFVFRKGHGTDVITDYQAGGDRLMIDEDLLAASVPQFYDRIIEETRSGVVLDFGNGNKITINGTDLTAEQIADDIFLF